MIYLAYEEMANHTDKISFPYINKVLESWHDQGITSGIQVEEAKQQRAAEKQKPAQKKKTQGYEASYDIDEFDKMSQTAPLVYRKKADKGEE